MSMNITSTLFNINQACIGSEALYSPQLVQYNAGVDTSAALHVMKHTKHLFHTVTQDHQRHTNIHTDMHTYVFICI